jgi:hypothetical protein
MNKLLLLILVFSMMVSSQYVKEKYSSNQKEKSYEGNYNKQHENQHQTGTKYPQGITKETNERYSNEVYSKNHNGNPSSTEIRNNPKGYVQEDKEKAVYDEKRNPERYIPNPKLEKKNSEDRYPEKYLGKNAESNDERDYSKNDGRYTRNQRGEKDGRYSNEQYNGKNEGKEDGRSKQFKNENDSSEEKYHSESPKDYKNEEYSNDGRYSKNSEDKSSRDYKQNPKDDHETKSVNQPKGKNDRDDGRYSNQKDYKGNEDQNLENSTKRDDQSHNDHESKSRDYKTPKEDQSNRKEDQYSNEGYKSGDVSSSSNDNGQYQRSSQRDSDSQYKTNNDKYEKGFERDDVDLEIPEFKNHDFKNPPPKMHYNGDESYLQGKEYIYANDEDFKVHNRFREPKSSSQCQQAKDTLVEGYKHFFHGLHYKNEAEIALSLGRDANYDRLIEQFSGHDRMGKQMIVEGSDILFKKCNFKELLCYLSSLGSWRLKKYKEFIRNLFERIAGSKSDLIQSILLARIKYITKKVDILKERDERREEMIQKLNIQCKQDDYSKK